MQTNKCQFIAELGINHHGKMEKAFRMIGKSIDAGATYVKGQFYAPVKVLGKEHPDLDYAKECYFTRGQHETLAKYADARGGKYFVSVFDCKDVRWAGQFGVMKVASRMNQNQEFLAKVNGLHLPTYMSVQPEITVNKRYSKRFSMLWCVREYPTAKETILQYPYNGFGLSSHCPDWTASLEAYKLGARVFENHLCEAKDEKGCDIGSSLDFAEYAALIKACK